MIEYPEDAKNNALIGLTFLENVLSQKAEDAQAYIASFNQQEIIDQLTTAAAAITILTSKELHVTPIELIQSIRHTLIDSQPENGN